MKKLTIEFSDQRLKTAFLILASTAMRIGALPFLKISDLERKEDLYKVTVYSGDKEQYITFCTPECAKEIDSFLESRKRKGEHITSDSYVLVKRFSKYEDMKRFKRKPLIGDSLRSLLQDTIENSGLRKIDHDNPHKRKQVSYYRD